MTTRAIVVGAGIAGLSAAWHLLRRGCNVTLIEQHHLGHTRGSSHGASRVTRSAYVDARYVALMAVAHSEAWPELEAAADERLVHRCDGAIFGPATGPYPEYADAVRQVSVDVEEISIAEATRRFPLLRFPNAHSVLHDRTAGVIAADATRAALARLLKAGGARISANTAVTDIDPAGPSVATSRGRFDGDVLVVCAGSWVPRIVPELRERCRCVHQVVAFCDVEGPPARLTMPHFPVWYDVGDGGDAGVYGLPSFGHRGLKVARYKVSGADDPDQLEPDDVEGRARDARDQLAAHLAVPVGDLVGHEVCRFTMTDDEHCVVDHLPGTRHAAFAAGLSGHGFKLGPLLGRALAELVLDGKSSMPAFEAARELFALSRSA